MFEVVIVGGGPAGLNAALLLGRARRRVLLCDAGAPRNAPVAHLHGFLSRDGLPPAELGRIGRDQLAAYPSVALRQLEVAAVSPTAGGDGLVVTLADGTRERARRLLLATGVVDQLPAIDGLAGLWGRSVFNCPYCHGWEVRDQPLAVLGTDQRALQLAVHLTRWSDDVVWCSNGPLPAPLAEAARAPLAARGVRLHQAPIVRLEGDDGQLARIVLATGAPLERRAAFLHPPTRQRSALPGQLGCVLLEDGSVSVGDFGQASVAGVFAAGDMARRPTMPHPGAQVVIAAAEGAIAAIAIDQDLVRNDLASSPLAPPRLVAPRIGTAP
jgi:thioredoxin reductase